VLIKALLTAYLEVFAHKLTLRNLNPSSAMLDRTLSQIVFTDITELCSWEENLQPSSCKPLPYSAI
jgi:hypothetical protein